MHYHAANIEVKFENNWPSRYGICDPAKPWNTSSHE